MEYIYIYVYEGIWNIWGGEERGLFNMFHISSYTFIDFIYLHIASNAFIYLGGGRRGEGERKGEREREIGERGQRGRESRRAEGRGE